MIRVKPLSPKDIEYKELSDNIIERVNNLIRKNWNGYSAEVILDHIACPSTVYQNGDYWRAIIRLYREYGWDVELDFPDCCENYKAKLIFKKAKLISREAKLILRKKK